MSFLSSLASVESTSSVVDLPAGLAPPFLTVQVTVSCAPGGDLTRARGGLGDAQVGARLGGLADRGEDGGGERPRRGAVGAS